MITNYLLPFLLSFIISILLVPMIIKISSWIKNDGQPIYEDCPQKHQKKQGTATLGGLAIIIATLSTSFMILDVSSNIYLMSSLIILTGYGMLGLVDDISKLIQHKNRNSIISPKIKILIQTLIVIFVIFIIKNYKYDNIFDTHQIKLYQSYSINITYIGYIIFFIFVIIGSSNATNLTDGLDGLLLTQSATILVAIASINHILHDKYNIEGIGDISILCLIISGAIIGLLWFNCNKATIFTGDVGSLSLGGTIGIISMLSKIEVILILVSIIFIVETLSVIIQVVYFKYTKRKHGKGKRVFKMTPIHHHFELSGLNESKIVIRFWICTVILCTIAIIIAQDIL